MMLAPRREPMIYRASRSYKLVPLERLSEEELELFFSEAPQPDLYGIARPLSPGLPVKSVTVPVALLIHTLATEGPLPRFVLERLGDGAHDLMHNLVLEGLLEIKDKGDFVSGPAALGRVQPPSLPSSDLSLAALRHVASLNLTDALSNTRKLYSFNRVPESTAWRKKWPGATCPWDALAPSWGLTGWAQETGASEWRLWRRRTSRRHIAAKLYLSVHPRDIEDAVSRVVPALYDSEALAFKLAATRLDLLRADKFVLYFPSTSSMHDTALVLDNRISEFAPHEVPFTCVLDGCARVTWGADPAKEDRSRLLPDECSWRTWICERAGTAIAEANSAGLTDEVALHFVLSRVASSGVDPTTWAPAVSTGG